MSINKTYEQEFYRFLECLRDAGCLEHVVVIGSWAEYLYYKSGLLQGYVPAMQTIDVDFLISNLNRPRNKSELVSIARERGFLYEEERSTGVSRFIGMDNFEVEFLIQQRGSGAEPLPRTKIGVNAQQLTHLSILNKNQMTVRFERMPVQVPVPEAYVLQKMIVNEQRGYKREKDIEKIRAIYPLLDTEEYRRIKNSLTKKEQKLVDTFENEKLHIV